MATLVQVSSQLSLSNADPIDMIFPSNVVAGNTLYCLIVLADVDTVVGITDTQGNTWSQKGQYSTASSNMEIWQATAGSSAACTLTVDLTGQAASAQGVLCEVEHDGTPVDGPSNTLDQTVAADPMPLATLTTTDAGIIFTMARIDSNFGISGWTDSFASLPTGSQLGRSIFGYRITTAGVSAVPQADLTSVETGDSLTIAFYDALTIRGSWMIGADGDISSTRTVLVNVDGVERTVSASGSLVVGGSLMLIEQASAPTAIANAVRMWAEDNGSGKTRVMMQFGTGSPVQIGIEP